MDSILYHIHGGVGVITLNRPDRLNSFNTDMHQELQAALDRVEEDMHIRCLLLTGAGRGFCAGQDLNDRKVKAGDQPVDLGDTLDTLYNPLIRRLNGLKIPSVCAVNGVAAGAGANLALAFDFVLAAKSARFIQAFCKIGLVPDSGGTYMLPRLVGMARAKGLAMLGDALSAQLAADWGLIWRAVEDEKLMEEAMALATHLSTQPTSGLMAIKNTLHASLSNNLDAQLDLERDTQRKCGQSHDYKEGVAAFLNKRPPRFKGH